MPIPVPNIGENRTGYISRCISFLSKEGTPVEHAKTICIRKWEHQNETSDPDYKPIEFMFFGAWADRTFKGVYNPYRLPQQLYEHNYTNTMAGVGHGFGLPMDFIPTTARYESAVKYRQNVSFFSGAKTFQQQMILSNAVFNPDGSKRSFKEFMEIAERHNVTFNKQYLQTEMNAAYRVAQGAENWHEIQDYKDILPYIQYVTVGDERVRPEHAAWDNIILPVDHPFWDTHFPPNDWNCRCIATSLIEGEPTNLTNHLRLYNLRVPKEQRVKNLNNTSKVFANNPGKTGLIFGKSHPYFNMPKKYKKSALDNFGFVIPFDDEVKAVMKKV